MNDADVINYLFEIFSAGFEAREQNIPLAEAFKKFLANRESEISQLQDQVNLEKELNKIVNLFLT